MIPATGLGIAACGSSSSNGSTTTSKTSTAATAAAASGAKGNLPFAGHAGMGSSSGSNARSTNAAGGALGTVSAMTSSGFTLATPGGGSVTVKESSSTIYQQGTSTSTSSAVTKGSEVLVFGKVNSTTITGTKIVVQPGIDLKTASAKTLEFQQGSQGSNKSVGQIPKNYTQGSGKLVSGTTADQAIEAALESYAGGVIDRVVQLSGGEFEVHHIGVNWPHHIFVNKDFKVVGAND
jgi:hypothetical protein